MPNPPRRRPARKRPLSVILYATMAVVGLALGSTLVLVTVPRRKAVAQATPPVAPRAYATTPTQPPPALPVPTPAPAPAVPAAVAQVRTMPSPETPPPAAPVAAKKAAAAVAAAPVRVVRELVVKRMHQRTGADILGQITAAPALSLDRSTKRAESIEMIKAARQAPLAPGVNDTTLLLLDRRADLAGLPFRRGSSCRIAPAAARNLARRADEVKFKGHEDLATTLASGKEWLAGERIPALMQVVMAQPEKNRRNLARHLGEVRGWRASEALARIALYDPEPAVRRDAVDSLQKRPAAEYIRYLLRGFESPWPVIAEHAAEAIAALKRTEAVPALLALLDGHDPQAPYFRAGNSVRVVKELVRVNHKINCLLCHPPSFNVADPARAAVPPLRESFQSFGYSAAPPRKKETFVRADITYLKQDYSVTLEKANSPILRGEQRYDLFVRERLATSEDFAATVARRKAGPTGHQLAALFALRELTGAEPGAGRVNWRRFARR
jgi:hypothetical protein